MACLDLVTTIPPVSAGNYSERDFGVTVSNLGLKLHTVHVVDHVMLTISPLLAILPQLDTIADTTFIKVHQLLTTIVEAGALQDGKLLTTELLGESLILTLSATIRKLTSPSEPMVELLAGLAKSLIVLQNEESAMKSFNLINQLFLLCESFKTDCICEGVQHKSASVAWYHCCLHALGVVILNCAVTLMSAMQMSSFAVLSQKMSSATTEETRNCLLAEIGKYEHLSSREFE